MVWFWRKKNVNCDLIISIKTVIWDFINEMFFCNGSPQIIWVLIIYYGSRSILMKDYERHWRIILSKTRIRNQENKPGQFWVSLVFNKRLSTLHHLRKFTLWNNNIKEIFQTKVKLLPSLTHLNSYVHVCMYACNLLTNNTFLFLYICLNNK